MCHRQTTAAKEITKMTTFTIDNDNAITAFASSEEAAAAGGEVKLFASAKELSRLASDWPAERLVEIWNGLPGVEAVTKFKSAKVGVARIWERIQGLGEPAKPKAEPKVKAGAKAAKGAPAKGKATKKASPAKKVAKATKGAKPAKTGGPREGSKTAQVVASKCVVSAFDDSPFYVAATKPPRRQDALFCQKKRTGRFRSHPPVPRRSAPFEARFRFQSRRSHPVK
jgi:hypothetical protein